MADEDFYGAWFQPRGARVAEPPAPPPPPPPPPVAPPESTGPPRPVPIAAPKVPIGSPPAAPTPNNALTPPAAPPALIPKKPMDYSTDFNAFMKQMLEQATGYGDPTARLSPFNPNHRAQILNAQADKEQDVLTQTQLKLAASQRRRAELESEQLKPLWEEQDKIIAAEMKELRSAQGNVPDYKPPPTINPQDAQSFLMSTLAVALVGGLAGKAGWMRVSQYMNGAMQGLIEGSKERAEEYYRAYKIQYEQATGKLKAQQERWRDILYATDVPINRLIKQAEIQAKIDGSDEKWLMAQQGHIDKLRNQAQAEEKMVIGLDQKRAALETQIETSLVRLGAGQRGALGANLDEYGKWAAAKIAVGGNPQLLATLTARWASPQRAEVWNLAAKEMYEQGIDPTVVNQNQISLHVERAAQRWSKVRWEAMGRLEQSLTELEPVMNAAIAQANQLHSRAFNTPMNELIRSYGAGPKTERIGYAQTLAYTVGREYATLATMPVSNAQMHWGAQEKADKMVSGNMSLAELRGFYNAVKQEITINRKALRDATLSSMQDVMSLGGSVNPKDYGLPDRQEPTPEQRVEKYGPSTSNAPASQ